MGKKYEVIYADPPWSYANKATRASADDHYATMSIDDLKAMPVADIAAKDAVLFLWWTPTHAAEALELVKAWGFKFKNMNAFTWCKLNRKVTERLSLRLGQFRAGYGDNASTSKAGMTRENIGDAEELLNLVLGEAFMGMGNYTRGNAECVLVATRGKTLDRRAKNIKQMVIEPLAEHSSKPVAVTERIEKLYPHAEKLEMFARTNREGWDAFGNEDGVEYAVTYSDGEFK